MDYVNAFWVGGFICIIGQLIFEFCKYIQINETNSYAIVFISLIVIVSILCKR